MNGRLWLLLTCWLLFPKSAVNILWKIIYMSSVIQCAINVILSAVVVINLNIWHYSLTKSARGCKAQLDFKNVNYWVIYLAIEKIAGCESLTCWLLSSQINSEHFAMKWKIFVLSVIHCVINWIIFASPFPQQLLSKTRTGVLIIRYTNNIHVLQ